MRTRPAARFSVSATQVIASALAAITATVAASYLGVAGTVIGAGVASVMTVVGNAVYSHSIRPHRRAGARCGSDAARAGRRVPRCRTGTAAPRDGRATAARWQVMAAACVGVFAGVLVVVTASRSSPDVR